MANAFEAVAAASSRSGRNGHALALRLTAMQLLHASETASSARPATPVPRPQRDSQGSQDSSASAFTVDGGLAASPTRDALLSDVPLMQDAPLAASGCAMAIGDPMPPSAVLAHRLQARGRAVAAAARHNADALARCAAATGPQGALCWLGVSTCIWRQYFGTMHPNWVICSSAVQLPLAW